jgi:hypothetical protein
MKNNKCHPVESVPKYNRKIVERDKIHYHNTQIHRMKCTWPLIFWLGTDIEKERSRVKLVWGA